MFRVPSDAEVPTFDQTFKVGFFRWLTSSGTDRREWTTRRMTATRLKAAASRAAANQRYADRREQLRVQAAEIRRQISAELAKRRSR